MTELRTRADTGDKYAQSMLAEQLATRGSSGSWQPGYHLTVAWREDSGSATPGQGLYRGDQRPRPRGRS